MSHLERPCFIDGKFVALKDANVNIQTHALQYGTACFGGMRGYWNNIENQMYLFRTEDHFNRIIQSGSILQMNVGYNKSELKDITIDLVKRGEWKQNIYLRHFVFKSDYSLTPALHNVKDSLAIYIIPLEDYLDVHKGLNVCISSWVRISDNQIPARAKASGGYINSSLAKSEAILNGYDEAIFLDTLGNVCEGSSENIFLVKNGVLITPDLNSSILEGITRNTIIQLAKDLNIPLEERKVSRTELYTADEVFFTGTGVQVAWIKSIDQRIIGTGVIGSITKQIQDLFFKVVTGNEAKYKNWLTPVK